MFGCHKWFGLALLLVGLVEGAHAATLTVQANGETRQFSSTELLANPATKTIEVVQDASYHRAMRYQAIPLLDLLNGLPTDTTHTLEAHAIDGFASQIP